MPRQKSLITIIREFVQEEVRRAMAVLLGSPAPKKAAKNGRRAYPGRTSAPPPQIKASRGQ